MQRYTRWSNLIRTSQGAHRGDWHEVFDGNVASNSGEGERERERGRGREREKEIHGHIYMDM